MSAQNAILEKGRSQERLGEDVHNQKNYMFSYGTASIDTLGQETRFMNSSEAWMLLPALSFCAQCKACACREQIKHVYQPKSLGQRDTTVESQVAQDKVASVINPR